jgi:hypothetical protein
VAKQKKKKGERTPRDIDFDTYPEARLSNNEEIESDNKPLIGEIVEGKKIVRVKPIAISDMMWDSLQGGIFDTRLRFKEHASRPFVYWLVELER